MATIKFTIPGKPIVQQRARIVRYKNGFTSAYDPNREDKQAFGIFALKAKTEAKLELLTGDLKLRIQFHGCRSNSDLSNFIKLAEDAMNGIIYKDDRQIVIIYAEKFVVSSDPRTEVEVIELKHSK